MILNEFLIEYGYITRITAWLFLYIFEIDDDHSLV